FDRCGCDSPFPMLPLISIALLVTAVLTEEPVITEHPLDVVVPKGSPATLNCQAKPSDAIITWYKDGQQLTTNKEQVTSHRILLDTGSLFLLRVNQGKNGKDADAGTYHCEAHNADGTARSREGVLKIAMLKEEFRSRPRPVQALAGDKATLECSPPRGYPEPIVTWKKDDKEIRISDEEPRMSLHPDGNLVIESVRHTDSGQYVCVATNMVGERTSPPARLSVYEKPKFILEPSDITVDVGSSVLFDCRVSGEPQPQISWKKANAQMPAQRAYIAQDNRGLKIDRVQVSDEGEYICNARNPAGSIEATARLRVQAPPAFVLRPQDLTVDQGGRAQFECTASGQPNPAIYWSKEGSASVLFPGHTSSDGRITVSQTGELHLSDVRPHDEGNYICAAINSAGSSVATTSLMITGKTLELRAPPIIEFGPANQTMMVVSSALLPCAAIAGRPESTAPSINWLFNGIPVDTEGDTRMSQHKGGALHIADLKKGDSGVYTCRARNEDGETTWTASLTVEDTNTRATFFRMPDPIEFPSAPGQPEASNVSHDSLDLSWSAPLKNGASPISGYVLQYYSPEEAQTWYNVADYVSGTRHRVRNLKPSQSYLFVVRAENEKGIGPPSTVSNSATTKIAPINTRQDRLVSEEDRRKSLNSDQLIKLEEVKTINSTAVRLFWKKKPGKVDPGVIDGYYVKWRGGNSVDAPLVNVSGEHTDSVVVNGLLPFNNYEFFVIPYSGGLQGVPSNSMDALTAEAPPSLPPQDVLVRMLNLTTLRISWKPPAPDGLNGILKGFQIIIIGKGVKFNRNITTNERAASVTLFHLIPEMSYKIKVSARTGAGIGVPHGTDTIKMDQETLDKHTSQYSDEPWFFSSIKRSWIIVIIVVVLWIALMGVCVAFVMRRKRNQDIGGDRTFIEIKDGSLVAPSGPWGMDPVAYHTNSRMINGTLGHPRVNGTSHLYTRAPNQHDFYNPYDDNLIGTLGRPGSEPHYQYAQVTGPPNNMSTFYGNQYHDDPSPYATTTLVTTSQQPAWLSDKMLRGPALPSNPVPNCPPPRFAPSNGMDMGTGRRSRSSRGSEYKGTGHGSNSDSPPHTDVSYIQMDPLQSSDGTGGSTNGRSKMSTLDNRRSPPKHNLVDFIPPPPPGAPPPTRDDYYGDFEQNGRRPTSRNRNAGRVVRSREDESQRSSLMDDNHLKRPPVLEDSSEADGENSDGEVPKVTRLRPSQPAMGISASTLSQSTYEGRGSTGRFKSMQRPIRAEQ
ncbi:hypothetical protein PMAYCL1PPCAC_30892, partial [Pristionchus mayeri]